MFSTIFRVVALAGVGALVYAQEAAPATARFDHLVRNDFFAGFNGDKAALDRGLKVTGDILKTNPDHAEALVWHGSGIYYLAGQAFQQNDQEKGMQLFEQSMAEMDRAVQLAPKNIGVRAPRGAILLVSTLYMPEDVSRPLIEKGLSDYEVIYELQKADLGNAPEHPKGELLMGLASAHHRLGNAEKAKEFYGKVAAEMKSSVYGKNASTWLSTGALGPRQQLCLGCHAGSSVAAANGK